MSARDFSEEFPKNFDLWFEAGAPCAIYFGPNPESPGFGIQESNGPEGRRATVYFLCYWDDRMDLVAGLLGTVDYIGGTITRTPPYLYPTSKNDSDNGVFDDATFCTSISSIVGIKPWTDATGENVGQALWAGYCYAIVQAEFTTPPYQVESDDEGPEFIDLSGFPYVTTRIRVSGETFSPPSGSFIWSGGGFANSPLLDVGAAQIRTRLEITCTRLRMPIVPMNTISRLEGSVNEIAFTIGTMDFPRGSVLFTGTNPEPRCDPYNGGVIYDIDFTFMANGPAGAAGAPGDPLDWNYFLDPGGAWSPVTTKGGAPVFTYQDILQLFDDNID